jgi:hypothetical protein
MATPKLTKRGSTTPKIIKKRVKDTKFKPNFIVHAIQNNMIAINSTTLKIPCHIKSPQLTGLY